MNIFKKKNAQTEEENKEKDVKLLILECLNEKLQGTIYDNCLLLPRTGFSIDVQIGKSEEKDGINLLQVIYILKHDDLDESIIEPVAAQGKGIEMAVQMAVDSFRGGLWHPLQMASTGKGGIHVTSNYLKQHYDYDMYAQSVVLMGDRDKKPAMLINFIKDVIPRYLGSKKYYWVRIFLARHKDKKTIEVRVNGTVCPGLHQCFQKYIDSWEDKDILVTEKQYAIFVQREDDKCPFTKEHVVNCARRTIELMENCNSSEDYQNLKKEIDELAGNISLSTEIRIFIPEIFARIVLGYGEGDSLFLIEDSDDKNNEENAETENQGVRAVEFKKTQLRSYFYLQQVVLDYLNRVKPEKEKVMKIVANSVAFKEMQKAVKDGHDPRQMFVPGTSYKIVAKDYKVW